MANTIQLKQSSVAGKVPTAAQLALGEVAVNTYDGKAYTKRNVTGVETVLQIGGTRAGTITTGATITPDCNAFDQYAVTALATGATIAAPSGAPVDGQRLMLRLKDDGSARALSWTTTVSGYRPYGTTLPTTTVAGKVMYVGCIYNAQDAYWDVVAVSQQY